MKKVTMIVDGTEYTVEAKSRLDAWKKVEKLVGKDLNTCKTQIVPAPRMTKKAIAPYGDYAQLMAFNRITR